MIISWFSLQVEEGDPCPLLSTGKATPGVQCPVVGSSVQERYRATRQSPLPLGRAAKMIKALEHLLEEEKAERSNPVQPGEEMAQEDPLMHTNI